MANRPKIASRNRINQLSRSSRIDNTFLRASDLEAVLNYLDENIRPYTVYTALLTQELTNDPVVTVLENTTSLTVTWTRNGASGQYTGTLSSPITNLQEKCFILFSERNAGGYPYINYYIASDTQIILYTGATDSSFNDDLLSYTPVEIRIYS